MEESELWPGRVATRHMRGLDAFYRAVGEGSGRSTVSGECIIKTSVMKLKRGQGEMGRHRLDG
jgi:hypothetical protein